MNARFKIELTYSSSSSHFVYIAVRCRRSLRDDGLPYNVDVLAQQRRRWQMKISPREQIQTHPRIYALHIHVHIHTNTHTNTLIRRLAANKIVFVSLVFLPRTRDDGRIDGGRTHRRINGKMENSYAKCVCVCVCAVRNGTYMSESCVFANA